MNVLDTIKRHIFFVLYFCCQTSPGSVRAPDSGLWRLQETSDIKSIKTKKVSYEEIKALENNIFTQF